MKSTKQIVGVGLLTLVGTSFAMAQTPVSSTTPGFWQGQKQELRKVWKANHKEKREHRKDNKKAVHEAIVAGDFAKFQTLASTTPIGKIDVNTFNNLSAQMKIIQAAKTQVDAILKGAGIDRPFHMGPKTN